MFHIFFFAANLCNQTVELNFDNATFDIADINNAHTGDTYNITCDMGFHIAPYPMNRSASGQLNCTSAGNWEGRHAGCAGKYCIIMELLSVAYM